MIEMGKQYVTRDGCEARVLQIDGNDAYPVVGCYRGQKGWIAENWSLKGEAVTGCAAGSDLIEVKPKVTRTYWLVHENTKAGGSRIFDAHQTYGGGQSPEDYVKLIAKQGAVLAITGPHTVEFTEGEGLS